MEASLNSNQSTYADIETSSDAYALRFSGKSGKWLLDRQNSIIARMLSRLQPTTILDVGGGHGQIAAAFINKGYKITVMGSSSSCNSQINKLCTPGSYTFRVGDIEKLPYPDRSFDVVTCIRYLSHTDNWRGVISELCRVSKYGVIIDYPPLISVNLFIPILFALKKRFEGNTRTYTIFKSKLINETFHQNNFELETYNAQFLLPMVLHRILKSPTISSILEFIPKLTGLVNIFGSPALACYTAKRQY